MMDLQTPPNDVSAEESVLSALFLDNRGFEDLDALKPEDFYKGAHRKIYRTMLSLRRQKEPVDLVTTAQELKANGELDAAGGASYLSQVSDSAPVALNVAHYAKIVQDLANVRHMIRTAYGIVQAGYQVQDVEEYIGRSQSEILDIQTTTSQDKFYGMTELVDSVMDKIDAAQNSEKPVGHKLGMPIIDNIVNVSGSKLSLIAGRPGMGKTALALSMARFLIGNGVKVGFLSIEMDKDEITERLLGKEANVNPLWFYDHGRLTEGSMSDLMDAAGVLARMPVVVDDADCNIQDVERKSRKMVKMGCQVIFIDQLSKIRASDPKKSKFDTYSDHCSSIALLKKELRTPIFLMCQLNRNVEQRQDKRPLLGDLKQTGMLEEDADMVFLLYRPGYYELDTNPGADQSKTEIILAKNRQGARGVEHNVPFDAKRVMFDMKG